MTDLHPDTVTPLDLDDTTHSAVIKARGALHQLSSILADTQRLIRIIEGEIEDHRLQAQAEAIANSLRDAVLILTDDTAENAEIIAALSAGTKTLLAQRDHNLDARRAAERALTARVADAMQWSLDEADKFLTLLSTDDTALMEHDLIFDLGALDVIRDTLQDVLADVDWLME